MKLRIVFALSLLFSVLLSTSNVVIGMEHATTHVIIPMPDVDDEKSFYDQIDPEKEIYVRRYIYKKTGYVVVYLDPLQVDKELKATENYTDYATSVGFFPQFFNYRDVVFKVRGFGNNIHIEDLTFIFGTALNDYDGTQIAENDYYTYSIGYPTYYDIQDGETFYPIYLLVYDTEEFTLQYILDTLERRSDVYFARPLYSGEETLYREEVILGGLAPEYHPWYTEYVSYVKKNGIMNGVNAAGDFAPNGQLTRAQLVQILYNMYGNGAKPEKSEYGYYYDDVYHGEWYYDAMCWAIDNYIINGVGDRIMAPNEPITREMFVTLMYRAADTLGLSCENYVSEDISGITDLDIVSEWALEAATWAAEGGLMSGTRVGGEMKWLPGDVCTRAQAAKVFALFHNYHSAYAPESGMTESEFYDMLHNR